MAKAHEERVAGRLTRPSRSSSPGRASYGCTSTSTPPTAIRTPKGRAQPTRPDRRGTPCAGIGTLAGDVVLQGFLGRRIPVYLRRLVTMTPAVAALLSGASLTGMLVLSQVVISFGVPVVLFLLMSFCSDRALMGPLVNARLTTWVAAAAGGVVALLACSLPIVMLF
ncbi:divalent metal cation transporter [Nonomuraea maritima]|uniref:divalent metal cation transporter n=1 Tax=Nonomuraea maritima TaxID=683260 RepID=UPI00371FD1B5